MISILRAEIIETPTGFNNFGSAVDRWVGPQETI